MTVSRTKLVAVALVIFAVTVWLFWPSVHGEFLNGDDYEYLRQSVRLYGLTWNAVKWAFTCTDEYYQPLPRLSHVLDYQMFGTSAAGHHATGIVFHALNATLVFGFLWTLLGATALTTGERLAVASWVAVVFAIHPLQTESLAWTSGRTQQLCTMFGIGCLWAYAAGARRWLVWTLYVAALLCKPMAVSVPFVMLAIDYYPLRRHERLGWVRLVWEKAAWIVLAGAAGLATVITKSQIGNLIPLTAVPLSERLFLVFESLTFYPLKLVWPSHLLPVYPITPGLSLHQWPVLGSVLSVVVITTVVIMERQRTPMLAAAWGAYLALILPVSGLMLTVMEAASMRFAYAAMVPLLLLASGIGVWVWRRLTTAAHLALIGLLAGQLCFFGVRTRNLIPVWRNEETEWRAVLVEFPDYEVANRSLAAALLVQGRIGEALEYAQRDIAIAPQLGLAHNILGTILMQEGKVSEAIGQYKQALRLDPDYAAAHNNLALVLGRLGKSEDAIKQYQEAIQIKPDYAQAYNNLGLALEQTGRIEEAIAQYEQALRIEPGYVEAYFNLGLALEKLGRTPEAIDLFQRALRIDPDSVTAHVNLGNALLAQGKPTDAIRNYEQALRIDPDDAKAHYNLGLALAQSDRLQEAIEQWEQTLRINPHDADAHFNMAVAFEKMGRPPEAIEHYQQALKLRPGFGPAKDALTRLAADQ